MAISQLESCLIHFRLTHCSSNNLDFFVKRVTSAQQLIQTMPYRQLEPSCLIFATVVATSIFYVTLCTSLSHYFLTKTWLFSTLRSCSVVVPILRWITPVSSHGKFAPTEFAPTVKFLFRVRPKILCSYLRGCYRVIKRFRRTISVYLCLISLDDDCCSRRAHSNKLSQTVTGHLATTRESRHQAKFPRQGSG